MESGHRRTGLTLSGQAPTRVDPPRVLASGRVGDNRSREHDRLARSRGPRANTGARDHPGHALRIYLPDGRQRNPLARTDRRDPAWAGGADLDLPGIGPGRLARPDRGPIVAAPGKAR